jgi:hypothetical protein
MTITVGLAGIGGGSVTTAIRDTSSVPTYNGVSKPSVVTHGRLPPSLSYEPRASSQLPTSPAENTSALPKATCLEKLPV